MVSLVLVSHSHALAEATLKLVRAMAGDEISIAIAAGTGDNHEELGTDAMEIFQAITSVMSDDGVVVMMDMGSAVLSAEMALDFLDEDMKAKVRLCPSSFVEGSVAAGVAAKIGSNIDDVMHEASASLNQKTEHIDPVPIQNLQQNNITDLENADTIRVKLPMPHGLHARPVSKLVQEAAKYKSDIRIKDITNGKGPVSIKSITGIIALEALYGHEVELTAKGEDSKKALDELAKVIENGLGDNIDPKKQELNEPVQPETKTDNDDGKPIGISKGIVIAHPYYPKAVSFEFPDEKAEDTAHEIEELKTALSVTITVLRQKAKDVSRKMGREHGDIFLAQATMLEDPALVEKAKKNITDNKMKAAKAWWLSVEDAIEQYKQLKDDNLRQRAMDLQDVAHLVLVQFGIADNAKLDIPEHGIIITEDMTPGQAAALDKGKILGVICLENGQTSHSSILLRSRGIPSIVQAQRFPTSLRNLDASTVIAMDGESGEIWINPEKKILESIENRRKEWKEQSEAEKKESIKPATTSDGKRIEVFANVGRKEDSDTAAENNAEGIGLLRTEFMFLHRESAPNEEEQVIALREILDPMKNKPVIIRTLDAGGDKDLPYLNMPKEANPFLGVRAIRLTLRNPSLFQQQLRAILRISNEYDVRIMFPMISTLDELISAKAALMEAHESLLAEKKDHKWPIITGMMMEVPSAAIMINQFVKEIDFVSIGTNDLVQYTMAADRGNPELQKSLNKGFDPAVVTLISRIGRICKENNIPVAVCGESAANPELAGILIGLGVTELSMNASSIPGIKYWIRNQSITDLESKAKKLLQSYGLRE